MTQHSTINAINDAMRQRGAALLAAGGAIFAVGFAIAIGGWWVPRGDAGQTGTKQNNDDSGTYAAHRPPRGSSMEPSNTVFVVGSHETAGVLVTNLASLINPDGTPAWDPSAEMVVTVGPEVAQEGRPLLDAFVRFGPPTLQVIDLRSR